MTHDYIRHGSTPLFAALNVLDGTVISQCMARHRHQEFTRFLHRIEAAVLAEELVHAILDNYAALFAGASLRWFSAISPQPVTRVGRWPSPCRPECRARSPSSKHRCRCSTSMPM
jgi:hypothetical protein